ncbi:unnamed protein product [Heterosigma akashiwo]|mmetsp:Transcript_22122/g.34221  ORF Transcript_22122/g.34221 Transcript_22122/m.34221 type:complete len:252 (-) Transcript_22122:60-815(-)
MFSSMFWLAGCILLALSKFQIQGFTHHGNSPSTFGRSKSPLGHDATRFSTHRLYAEENEEVAADGEVKNEVQVDELLTSPAFLKKKIEVLKSTIKKKEDEIEDLNQQAAAEWAEWGEQIEKVRRDMAFVRERSLNETTAARANAAVAVLKEALPVADNFDRARESLPVETEGERAVQAQYEALYGEMAAAFEALGMVPIETVGQPFDYNFHEAVMQMPSDEYAEDVVCQEFQKGYRVGDQCIRPAMVAVTI